MSNITEKNWTETPSRFRMSGVDAFASACPSVIEGGQPAVAKRIVAGLVRGDFAGTPAWRPPS